MLNYFVILFLAASSSIAQARYPDPWQKEEGYIVNSQGILKNKKNTFYYIMGSYPAGSGHYDTAIRLIWNKDSKLAYDAELSVMVDTSAGKLSLKENLLIFTETVYDPKDNIASYCWIFDAKTETFTEKENCPKIKTSKKKK